jgi:PAS domain S-box-containing protein
MTDLARVTFGEDAGIFRLLVEAAPDAMIVLDTEGRIVFANTQTERLFGYSREELSGKTVELLIPERFRRTHVSRRMSFTHSPKARPMGSGLDLFGRKKDGTEFAVEISLSPVETAHHRFVSAAIRDVTERKQMEAAARRANQLLASAVESIQDALAVFDSKDELVVCNSAYRLTFGQAFTGPITGAPFRRIVEENVVAGVFELADEAPSTLTERLTSRHGGDHAPLEIRLTDGRTVRFVDRRTAEGGTVSTVWDITADVKREEELRIARTAAEAASAAKSEFLASMSHELRTPLNAVLGFAQLLQRDRKSPLNERQLERLGHVTKGGEHLLKLIDEVLDLSRIEAGRVTISVEPVGVMEVIEEVRTTLAPMASRHDVKLIVETPAMDLPTILADRTRLSQILMNFSTNAIKYGRPGGTATLSATRVDDFVRVRVADDGIGIPLEKQDKIFQPFQRAGQETGSIEGTGIGLAISKRLAGLMGGRVGFESAPGEGTVFWVDFPAHKEAAAGSESTAAARSDLGVRLVDSGQRAVVLYVEDNPANIAFMKDYMEDFGRVDLIVAPSAEIGIELARTHRPRLIIMDIHLPGISGVEAAARLRELPETREIPIVGLSAAAMVRDAERVREAGFFRYLTKPVKVDDLNAVLDEILGRSTV